MATPDGSDRLSRSITQIKDLRPGMKNVTCHFIVIDKGTTNHTKDGSVVRKCRVADKSASICFSLWNEQATAIEAGDILKLTKGYTSIWKGSMVLYSGKYGKLEKVGEFTMLYLETPDMSDTNQDFIAQHQQQQQQQRGQLPPPANSGGWGPERGPPTSSPGNGRMGNRQSVSGNWNGNNHISDRQGTPPPSLIAAPPPGHMTHEPDHMGSSISGSAPGPYHPSGPQQQQIGQFDLPHQHNNHRGLPLRHPLPSSTSNERYQPYPRLPTNHHKPDPRLGWR